MFGDRLELLAKGIKAKAEAIQKEIQIGKQEGGGGVRILKLILDKSFGPIPADTVSLISNASFEDIERWADRVFDAKQLSDIFNDYLTSSTI